MKAHLVTPFVSTFAFSASMTLHNVVWPRRTRFSGGGYWTLVPDVQKSFADRAISLTPAKDAAEAPLLEETRGAASHHVLAAAISLF